MGKASTLRLSDIRAAFRLIGDCRDVGDDPARWQEVVMSGVCRLAGAASATGGEGRWLRPSQLLQPATAHAFGLNDTGVALLSSYMRDYGVNADPIYRRLQHTSGRIVTRRRIELVSDHEWYRSPGFVDYRRRVYMDHQLTSMFQVSSTGAASCIAIHREVGDQDFSDRERLLLSFFHVELGRLIGGPLASALTSQQSLSPRLKQTLTCLVEGDSEKQAALKMGISRTTVHQYVTILYRRFGVQSRAELIVKVLRRRMTPT
ncbi:MAG: helix-turn-helix transcriptional regulator [Vicinamibacterales bacterium]